MRLSKKKPDKKKQRKAKAEPEIEEIEQPSTEEHVKELEAALASAEVRLRQLQDEIDVKADALVREKLRNTYEGFTSFLAAAEQRILEKIITFLNANPGWETKKVTKSTVGSEFYDPAKYFQTVLSQGWRWIGQGFDNTERYDLFIRPKKSSIERDALLKMYAEFHAKQAKAAKASKVSDDAEDMSLRILKKKKK